MREKQSLRVLSENTFKFSEFHAVTEEFLEAEDQIIIFGKYTGVGKNTGRRSNHYLLNIYTIKDEKIIKFRQYADKQRFKVH